MNCQRNLGQKSTVKHVESVLTIAYDKDLFPQSTPFPESEKSLSMAHQLQCYRSKILNMMNTSEDMIVNIEDDDEEEDRVSHLNVIPTTADTVLYPKSVDNSHFKISASLNTITGFSSCQSKAIPKPDASSIQIPSVAADFGGRSLLKANPLLSKIKSVNSLPIPSQPQGKLVSKVVVQKTVSNVSSINDKSSLLTVGKKSVSGKKASSRPSPSNPKPFNQDSSLVVLQSKIVQQKLNNRNRKKTEQAQTVKRAPKESKPQSDSGGATVQKLLQQQKANKEHGINSGFNARFVTIGSPAAVTNTVFSLGSISSLGKLLSQQVNQQSTGLLSSASGSITLIPISPSQSSTVPAAGKVMSFLPASMHQTFPNLANALSLSMQQQQSQLTEKKLTPRSPKIMRLRTQKVAKGVCLPGNSLSLVGSNSTTVMTTSASKQLALKSSISPEFTAIEGNLELASTVNDVLVHSKKIKSSTTQAEVSNKCTTSASHFPSSPSSHLSSKASDGISTPDSGICSQTDIQVDHTVDCKKQLPQCISSAEPVYFKVPTEPVLSPSPKKAKISKIEPRATRARRPRVFKQKASKTAKNATENTPPCPPAMICKLTDDAKLVLLSRAAVESWKILSDERKKNGDNILIPYSCHSSRMCESTTDHLPNSSMYLLSVLPSLDIDSKHSSDEGDNDGITTATGVTCIPSTPLTHGANCDKRTSARRMSARKEFLAEAGRLCLRELRWQHRKARHNRICTEQEVSSALSLLRAARQDEQAAQYVAQAKVKGNTHGQTPVAQHRSYATHDELKRQNVFGSCTATDEGSEEACGARIMPFTSYCPKHVMLNPDQQIFGRCTAKFANNTQCTFPVLDVTHQLPLCHEHTRKAVAYQRSQEHKMPKKQRKKMRCSTSPFKRKRRSLGKSDTGPAMIAPLEGVKCDVTQLEEHQFSAIQLDSVMLSQPHGKSKLQEENSEVESIDNDALDQTFSPGAMDLPMDVVEATRFLDKNDFSEMLTKLPEAFDFLDSSFKDPDENRMLDRALAEMNDLSHLDLSDEYGSSAFNMDLPGTCLQPMCKPGKSASSTQVSQSQLQPLRLATTDEDDDQETKHIASSVMARGALHSPMGSFGSSDDEDTGLDVEHLTRLACNLSPYDLTMLVWPYNQVDFGPGSLNLPPESSPSKRPRSASTSHYPQLEMLSKDQEFPGLPHGSSPGNTVSPSSSLSALLNTSPEGLLGYSPSGQNNPFLSPVSAILSSYSFPPGGANGAMSSPTSSDLTAAFSPNSFLFSPRSLAALPAKLSTLSGTNLTEVFTASSPCKRSTLNSPPCSEIPAKEIIHHKALSSRFLSPNSIPTKSSDQPGGHLSLFGSQLAQMASVMPANVTVSLSGVMVSQSPQRAASTARRNYETATGMPFSSSQSAQLTRADMYNPTTNMFNSLSSTNHCQVLTTAPLCATTVSTVPRSSWGSQQFHTHATDSLNGSGFDVSATQSQIPKPT